MSEWKNYCIGDLCSTISNTYNGSDDKVVLINTSDVLDGKILNHNFVENKNLKGQFKKTFIKNDILYSEIRPANKRFAFIDFDKTNNYIVSTKLMVLRPDTTKVLPSFLFSILKSQTVIDELQHLAETRSGTFPQITFSSELAPMKVLLPNLDMQAKIVSILDSIEEKISTNTAINNNLEQQAQAIFKSWFVDFEPFGGTLPKFAELVPIEKICKIVTKGTTPTTLGFSFVEQGINFIKAESILDNHSFDYNKFAYIDEVTYKKLSRSILEAKDIVFTIAGTLGRFAIIDEEVIPANTNQAVAIIRADIGKIEPEYLYTFFLGNWHNNYYSKRIQQAVQANLNLTTIKSLPIILLSQEYRIKYLNIIKPILWQIKYNEKENRILTQLRDTLLPKLMSGEIAVSEVDISADKLYEPANESKLSAEPYNSSGSFASASKNLPSEQSSSADKLLFSEEKNIL